MSLIVNEIFYSIQGETCTCGLPAVFIRLAGCNLDCTWCDTRYARDAGSEMELEAIIRKIEEYPSADHVTITGGEPLLQTNTVHLLKMITDRGWKCQIETNGSILIRDVPEKVRKIVDVKTPSSGESDSFETRNLKYLTDRDEVKFVIASVDDYEFARDFIAKYLAHRGPVVNFTPELNGMPAAELAGRILADCLPVRLNLQVHKLVWGDKSKGK
ncbi:MAG: radical SAM protein [Spirochaetes bacterium]|nr:radical SAM protein [Spirochaetota bacterium]